MDGAVAIIGRLLGSKVKVIKISSDVKFVQ